MLRRLLCAVTACWIPCTACTVAGFGIRLNKEPPNISFRKKDRGGINFTTTTANPKLDLEGEQRLASWMSGIRGIEGGSRLPGQPWEQPLECCPAPS